jgi:YidC/Oxa1 family membrane protein insertase
MYDRKTWVIVTLCALLLGANLYYQQKTHKAEADYLTKAQAAEKAASPALGSTDPAAAPQSGLAVDPQPPSTEEETVVLENAKIAFTFTNIGGGIKTAEFKDQFQVGSSTLHVIANSRGIGPIGGFANGTGETLDNILYSYIAADSIPGQKVVYLAKLPSGLWVKKTFSFTDPKQPGAPYLLDFDLVVENGTPGPLNLNQWSLFLGEASPLYQTETPQQTGFFWREGGSMHFKDASSFKGGMMSSEKNIQTSPTDAKIQFAGVANQFFTTVLRAKEPTVGQTWGRPTPFTLTPNGKPLQSVRAGLRFPETSIAPNDQKTLSYRLFIGPKDNTMLRKMNNVEEGWGDVMQYGFFSVVSRSLNWILNHIHALADSLSKNWSWGLSIIFLTIVVRACIWPLHAKSTRTMKRMSKLQPEIAKLKEKYPDDPNKLNTETMGLYRKFGINPLGGCLPMVIQIPIFFGFFKMLQYAVELRGQGFLWVTDLSQPDTLTHIAGLPINVLPIIMAITSFGQMAMTPKTGDKMQQRIMMFMPLMFFFFCYNYAAALALYWSTQNIFSIAQTFLMNKIPEPELKARGEGKAKTWVQRMAERQADLQKNRQSGGSMRDVTPEKKKPRGPRTGG